MYVGSILGGLALSMAALSMFGLRIQHV